MIDPEHEPSQGTVYQATSDGFKQLWQSKGWFGYPNEIFLAPDGMSLVRITRFPNTLDGKKLEDQPVLFLYFKGKLVKDYKLSELVREMGSIQDGSFGSPWMDEAEIVQSSWHDVDTDRKDEEPDEQTFRSYNHYVFRLKTLEKTELFFDLLDGKRIERKKIVNTKESKEGSGDPFGNQKSEPAGAGQPATTPKSKPEGKDKPQPIHQGTNL